MIETATEDPSPGNEKESSDDMVETMEELTVSLPVELTSMFETFECKLCNLKLDSPGKAYSHYEGKNHLKKVNKFMLANYNVAQSLKKVKFQPYYCNTCSVHLTSQAQLRLHLAGKQHNKNVQYTKRPWENIELKPIAKTDPPPKMKAEDESEPKAEVENIQEGPYCGLCDLVCGTVEQLTNHRKGSKHLKNLAYFAELVENEKRNIQTLKAAPKLHESLKNSPAQALPNQNIAQGFHPTVYPPPMNPYMPPPMSYPFFHPGGMMPCQNMMDINLLHYYNYYYSYYLQQQPGYFDGINYPDVCTPPSQFSCPNCRYITPRPDEYVNHLNSLEHNLQMYKANKLQ